MSVTIAEEDRVRKEAEEKAAHDYWRVREVAMKNPNITDTVKIIIV